MFVADMESPLGSKENDITEAIDETANESPYAEPLIPEQVRWFHKDCVDKRWIEFCGYDSLRIERAWRTRNSSLTHNGENKTEQQIVVRGGMYDVELDEMKCRSIYCAGNPQKKKTEKTQKTEKKKRCKLNCKFATK